MQPTCSVGAILALGGRSNLSRSSKPVPSSRTRLMAGRWAACGLWTVFVWVRFAVLRVCSVRQAVIQGKRPRRLIYNRRTPFGSSGIAVITVNLRLFLLWSPGRLSIRTQRPNQHVCFSTAIPKDPLFYLLRESFQYY